MADDTRQIKSLLQDLTAALEDYYNCTGKQSLLLLKLSHNDMIKILSGKPVKSKEITVENLLQLFTKKEKI